MQKSYVNCLNFTHFHLARFCSTNFNWSVTHLRSQNGQKIKAWREQPNDTVAPIKRGDVYYPSRTLPIYPYKKRYGHEMNYFNGGFLPRVKNSKRVCPGPQKIFSDPWSYEKAYFGRNDYIDILGDTRLEHVDLIDKGPYWVRGVPRKWNELQWLIRRNKYEGNDLKEDQPERYRLMVSRIQYLYKYYNVKLAGREGKYKRRYR